ncbi:trans-sialidase, putative, partial [Trypanosoma cruzi marinkellei]
LSRVWGNSLARKGHGVQGGFVSATINGQKVILVSRPVYSGTNGKETGRLHLWLTDMQRIYDVGTISAENENVATSTLLYVAEEEKILEDEERKETKGKLYCSYEVAAEDGKYNIAFVDLTGKLDDMRKVVAAWKKNDDYIAEEYGCGNEKDAKKRRDCDNGDLTKGLVGLLSNTSTDETWSDEYLCVNATVTNGERGVSNGLTFKGPKAGAVWPVGDMGQNVPYYFANNKFTLVATVSIDKMPVAGSSSIPLMGVRLNDTGSPVLFGLSYTQDKKWEVIFSNRLRKVPLHGEDAGWEPNTKYQVALKMNRYGGLSVYVDGSPLYDSESYYKDEDIYGNYENLQKLLGAHSISHFYIGGDGKSNSGNTHVTVSNVLLYNRLLNDDELNTLMKPNAVTAPEAEVLASESAPQDGPSSQSSGQDATLPPQEQDLPPKPSINENYSAVSGQTSSTDSAGSSTSAAKGKVEEEAPSSVGSASSLSLKARDGSPQKVLEADVHLPRDKLDSEQEHSSPSVGKPLTEQADEAVGATPQRKTTEDRPEHSTPSDASEDVEASSFHSATLTSDERTVGPEGKKDTNPHTAAGVSSSPDASHSTEMTPVDSATAAPGPGTDPATAQDHDKVLDGDVAAPAPPSTAPGETKIPSKPNATSPLDADVLLEYVRLDDFSAMGLVGDSTVHGCLSRVLLLLLLGLWGTAALC